jgi:hypothetical protein
MIVDFDTYCCEMMKRNVFCECNENAGDKTIFYSKRFDEYMIPVSEGGLSGICIAYCPWCGQKLPESKRERWFEELDEIGIEFSLFDTEQVPPSYLSDDWWKHKSEG